MKKIHFLLLALSFFSCIGVHAQLELPEDIVSWNFTIEQKGCEATIIGKVKMDEHWHINATKLPKGSFGYATKIEFKKSPAYKLIGGITEPKPIQVHDELADEDLAYHEGTVIFKQKIEILSDKDFDLNGSFSFQTCNEVRCLPDHTAAFKVKVKGCESAAAVEPGTEESTAAVNPADETNTQAKDPEPGTEIKVSTSPKAINSVTKDRSLLAIFILSFLSGLAALLTPCVFPMVPMTVSFFTKQSKTKAQGIKNATIYGISIIVIYILLGTAVTAIFGEQALNDMSTNPWFNFIFFLLLIFFAVSFLGAFEIRMPSSWINKADSKADKGGIIGIFFMALALALVSFSCTGPIVGTLIVEAARQGGITPIVGMFGFSLALALPFGLFAAFPGWMNTLPKSGGWLNSVKVVLGFLELALAMKFLSNADMTWDLHILERELFIAIWIAIFLIMTFYLFGKIRLPHDSPLERLSVGRALLGTTTLMFVLYMIPGLWGAPLKIISAFPPPLQYSESPQGLLGGNSSEPVEKGPAGTILGPQNINVFHDYDKALAYAKEVNKPLFVDFTGINCVNCRKMEQQVWGEQGIIETLKNDVVIVSLHVDEREELPAKEQGEFEVYPGKTMQLSTTGDKWKLMQIKRYNILAQPYYVMHDVNGQDLANGSADFEHHSNPADFRNWLNKGMNEFNKGN
ncbi:MAG: protein-disulfide reductase DsbD family protein [Bacteroidota bacterium]